MLKLIDDRSTRVIHAAADDNGLTLCGLRIVTIRDTRYGPASAITCLACRETRQ